MTAISTCDFGRYEILGLLSSGASATVYLARDRAPTIQQRLVCVKVLNADLSEDEEYSSMFDEEAHIGALLQHPNCVETLRTGEFGGLRFIAMEHIFGETLARLIGRAASAGERLPPQVVVQILAEVCKGLHFAHDLEDKGTPLELVHRDICPHNVMVTYDGQVKLLDFGVAKAATARHNTLQGIVKGRFSYMSPEHITGAPLDRRSDLYALGVVLFEAVTARRFHTTSKPDEMARAIVLGQTRGLADMIPEIDPDLDSICSRAVRAAPEQRFQTALEFGETLRGWLDARGEEVSRAQIRSLMAHRVGGDVERRRGATVEILRPTSNLSRALALLDADPLSGGDPIWNVARAERTITDATNPFPDPAE